MKPVVLCIMDGWGERAERRNNAVALARTPVFDRLRRLCPSGLMEASGRDVGLPDGQMGNSEVGHMNLGAGRIVLQDMPRIDQAVRNNTIADASQVRTLVERLRATQGACHVIGLISPGGVHSHQDHVAALANVVSSAGIDVMVHAILDGRDTPPKSALEYLHAFEAALLPGGTIVTVTGRFFAMDRDHRWERIAAAYRALVMADGHLAGDARQAVQMAYDRGETDEFVEPTILAGYPGMRGWRWSGRRQFPRRPGPRDPDEPCRSGIRGLPAFDGGIVRELPRHGFLFRYP